MWNHAIRQVTQHSLRNFLLFIFAVLLLLAAAPALAQTDTPTPTATAAPAEDYTCVFNFVFENRFDNPEYDGTSLYLKFPANDYLAGEVYGEDSLYPIYTDANCENEADWIGESIGDGGLAYASDRDTAWDICAANNSKKVTDVDALLGLRKYVCSTSDEPAPPDGQTERFQRLGYAWPSAPDNEPLTAAEALTECQATWSNATSVAYQWSAPFPGSWICLVSWTVQATPTPDPNGNSGSETKLDELIVYGHGFGRTADAGLAECQRKWSGTDAIARHPKLDYYWACLKSQTDQSETPTPTATATPTATETSTSTATPTATAAPAQDYTCVFDFVFDSDSPHQYNGTSLYLNFPANEFLAGEVNGKDTLHPLYTDDNCETKADWISGLIGRGGFAHASDRDTAWDICAANNNNKITDIDTSYGLPKYMCVTSDEPAPPGGQLERLLRMGFVGPSTSNDDPLTAAEALTACQAKWSNATTVAYHTPGPNAGTWVCLESWTAVATPTPDPNGNSGSNAEFIRFGHGFGKSADAGFAECQRKWPNTDAITRHPKLEKYWACMGSQTEQVEAPGRASDLSAEVSGGSVSLTWDAPADGGAATGYRILRRLPDQGEQNMTVLVDNTGSAATSYLDSSAVAGQRHVYRVQALNGGGDGQVSLPAQIVVTTNLLSHTPTAATTNTPSATATDTPTATATATVAPAPDFTCFRHEIEDSGRELYHKYPASNFLFGMQPFYADSSCETKVEDLLSFIPASGFAYASDRSTAWDICRANNPKKVTYVDPFKQVVWQCTTNYETASPGTQTARFLHVGKVEGFSAADDAVDQCQLAWPDTGAVVSHSPNTWRCLKSWTLEATPTPDPDDNSGFVAKVESLTIFGHGFGKTAQAGLTECQRKWSDTDAITPHPTLDYYWACLKSLTDQFVTPTATPVPTDTPTPAPTSTGSPYPTATDTPTPTDTPTATVTSTPALITEVEGGTCIFYEYGSGPDGYTSENGKVIHGIRYSFYIIMPESNFAAPWPNATARYSDDNCETEYIKPGFESSLISVGGYRRFGICYRPRRGLGNLRS